MNREVTMELLEKYGKPRCSERSCGQGRKCSCNRQRRRKRDCEYIFYQPGAGQDYQPEKERPLLDVRSLKLHAFSGNEALQSGNF